MNTDTTWFAVLVIILSTILAIALILAVVLLVKIIQIVKEIKKVVTKASEVADKAEHMAGFFEKTATPVALMKLVSNISDTIQKKAKK